MYLRWSLARSQGVCLRLGSLRGDGVSFLEFSLLVRSSAGDAGEVSLGVNTQGPFPGKPWLVLAATFLGWPFQPMGGYSRLDAPRTLACAGTAGGEGHVRRIGAHAYQQASCQPAGVIFPHPAGSASTSSGLLPSAHRRPALGRPPACLVWPGLADSVLHVPRPVIWKPGTHAA